MVNSKKASKSTIAIILLSLLLVLSLILTATGAWFTDSKGSKEPATAEFGTITLTTDGTAFGVFDHGSTTLTGKVMPGDDVVATITAKNDGNSAMYCLVKLVITVEGNDKASVNKWFALDGTDASATNVTELAAGASGELEKGFTLDGTVYGNDYEGKSISVSYEIRAIQVKNVTKAQAYTYLTTTGTFNDTTALSA